MTASAMKEQYFTEIPDNQTWKKIQKVCSPVKTARGWWQFVQEIRNGDKGDIPWKRWCQPESKEFDVLTREQCIDNFGQGKLYTNEPQLSLD